MANATKYKTTNEQFDFTFDFVDDLVTGETISTKAVTAIDSAGVDKTSTVIDSSTISGTKVVAVIKAGLDLEDYRVLFKATSSGNDVFEKLLELRVRDNLIGDV